MSSITERAETYICFTCHETTTRDGSGTTGDPYVVAEHDDGAGESCNASGSRWLDWLAA